MSSQTKTIIWVVVAALAVIAAILIVMKTTAEPAQTDKDANKVPLKGIRKYGGGSSSSQNP